VDTPASKISHVDLVVSSIERSLPFYRELLEPLGWSGYRQVPGEQGETIHYLSVAGPGVAALGLRVDERAEWLRNQGARIESGPAEYDYTPGYYAVFFYDPDGIKLELLHRPSYWDWSRP
jgi:glyoxylase I family protein